MGLFSKNIDYTKIDEIEELYSSINTNNHSREEKLSLIDNFISLCKSITEVEENEFKKRVIKQSKRNRGIHSYDHPLYGYHFEDRSLIDALVGKVKAQKASIMKAMALEEEFNSIEEIIPPFNKDYELVNQKFADIPEIKVQNITKSFDAENKLLTFVVVDIETTGLTAGKDKIVQLCALRYENLVPTEAFVSLVNPSIHIPKKASEINGIYDEDVKEAPKLSSIAEGFVDFVGKSPIVGYNIAFDLSFLFCEGINLIPKRKIYDAKPLAKKLYKNDISYYSLENVLSYNGIVIGNLHDAKVDCYATGMLFLRMIDEITSAL